MQGTPITPAYNQLYDLDAQMTVFEDALRGNNRALAEYHYPPLLAAFLSTHLAFLPQLKNYFIRVAHTIAPTCQLETMLYLRSLHHANERLLTPGNAQYISLMIATNDQPTFLYLLGISDLTLQQLEPHFNIMTAEKIQAIQGVFAEEQEIAQAQAPAQAPRERNLFRGA